MLPSTAPPSSCPLRASYASRLYSAESGHLSTPDSPGSAGSQLSAISSTVRMAGRDSRRRSSSRVSSGEYDADRMPSQHSERMLRLGVDAHSTAAAANASSASSSSTSSASLPSWNDLYRQQLLGLHPSNSSRRASTSASISASTAAPAPSTSPSLNPVASVSAASVPPLSSRQPLPSSLDESLPASSRQSLSAARPSASRLSVDSQPNSVGRQSLPSPSYSPSPAAVGARGAAIRATRTSLGQHSSAHKLALNPSTAHQIAKHHKLVASPAAAELSLTPSLLHSSLPFSPSALHSVASSTASASHSLGGQENLDPNIQLSHSLASLTLHSTDAIAKAQRDMRLLSPAPPAAVGRPAAGHSGIARHRAKKALFPVADVLATPLSSHHSLTPRTPAVLSSAGSVSSASPSGSGSGVGSSGRRAAQSGVRSARSSVSGMR